MDTLVVRFLQWLIRGYQLVLSPWMGRQCRFEPSCSHYGLEALEQHGAIKGFILTTWRVLRCQPLCKAGFDPVPTKGYWKPTAQQRQQQDQRETQSRCDNCSANKRTDESAQ
ncbi:MAG: membrane protein insertion efficiency factor YidD [Pseudomonadota bacterium]|nr:membrane protein insertion efficiency factor YidD [Pseudomonadota bacterium]